MTNSYVVSRDFKSAKQIASKLSAQIGFITTAALEKAAKDKSLIVVSGKGFVNFRHRRDGQTTIYEIAVDPDFQGQGIGKHLLYRLWLSCVRKGQKTIFAKCPEDLPSNGFYLSQGFQLIKVEAGKKRRLNCWEKRV
jgi:ribosomal protein S18 acetylase RimI-like enzyme